MRIIDREEVASLLDYPSLVGALRDAFRAGCTAPQRHHHTIDVPGREKAALLLMPAWTEGKYLGVKIARVFPSNAAVNNAAVSADYLLCDATDGRTLALIDGEELTARRTAATSVLAATYLADPAATRLVVVGTGKVARHLARAHCACLPSLSSVTIWGRTHAHARRLADELRGVVAEVTATGDLEQAVRTADIVSCATLATTPLVKGAWLRKGQHLDLVGGFRPDMREADDDAIAHARVFADTLGAVDEAGDLCQPIRAGILRRDRIGDLAGLVRSAGPSAHDRGGITVFKSAGAAIEDLAAATLAFSRAQR